ncbi:ATP-binding cassette domain-containing protein [Clostridium botulinum]|nr:ATP-binding cassette domain-containing protein [Clostridium botulinum]
MKQLIKLRNVKKEYGNKLILNNININILKGQLIGIIGNNGTGKSTLLKIIAGLTKVSDGDIVWSENYNNLKIRYVPDRFPKLKFTSCEYLYHMGAIEGLSKTYIRERLNLLFDIFDMNSMKNTLIKNLSKGSIQKISIIQSILTKPDVLLLDEPFSGEDNKSKEVFLYILQKLKAKGVTITLICHDINLINKLADKIIKIENGQVVPYVDNDKKVYVEISFEIENRPYINITNKLLGLKNVEQNDKVITILVDEKYSDDALLTILKVGFSVLKVIKNKL